MLHIVGSNIEFNVIGIICLVFLALFVVAGVKDINKHKGEE